MAEEMKIGEWTIDKNMQECVLTEQAKIVFEEATIDIVGYVYKPILYVGCEMLLGGSSYIFICKGQPVVPNPVAEILEITISKMVTNPDSKATIVKEKTRKILPPQK